jgi:energy-converting hydrogenase Eha subunit B
VKGATVDALIGTNVLSGSSGHQIVNAGIMEVESGALLTLAGIVNSGTLMINGDEIQFVGPISGGTTVIGNGVLSIQHSSSENVTFLSAGTGALVLDANYTGKVTSFGGNISQLIEFVLVASAGATVSYTSKSTDSGILDVISGGHTVATVNMVGHYTTADFHTSSFLGALTVTDPEVVEQKSGNASATIASGTVLEVNVPDSGKVTFAGKLADFTAQDSIDLPNIPFGVHTTLGYSEDSSDTGGILSVKNGLHTTSIALLGTYIAGSFVAAADGHGGTLVTEAQPHEQTLLAHPRA